MAEPATLPLAIRRGDTFIVGFEWEDNGITDLTGITIKAVARKEIDGSIWFDLRPKITDLSGGKFEVHLTAEETRQITESPLGSFNGVYDLQFSWVISGETYVQTLLTGPITISKDITY